MTIPYIMSLYNAWLFFALAGVSYPFIFLCNLSTDTDMMRNKFLVPSIYLSKVVICNLYAACLITLMFNWSSMCLAAKLECLFEERDQ